MFPALILVAVAAGAGPVQPVAIQERIAGSLADFKGVCGVVTINLITGEEIFVNAEAPFPIASTINAGVMIEAYAQAAEGRLRLDAPIVLHETDEVGGSGILNGLHEGLVLTVGDAVHLMVGISDNTATNLLLARLGTAQIDQRLELGLHRTRLFRPSFRD